MKSILAIIIFCSTSIISLAQNKSDAILGRWITEAGNCMVEVYKIQNECKGKIVWFKDKPTKPMDQWFDEKNPDKTLRTRKLLGLEVLNNLHYNADDDEWVGGQIYDATSGKKWDSVVWLTKDNLLRVKGYWLFRFLSETKTFKRV